jgi:polar amino acid transport system substrate-binding protein
MACDNFSLIEKHKLTLYTEHFPPYQVIGMKQELSGSSIDIIKNTLDSVDWPYEIKVLPWARAVRQVNTEMNSFIFSIARFPEREENFQWVSLLSNVKSKLLTSSESQIAQLHKVEEVKNYRMILKRDEASSLFFQENNLINKDKTIWVNDTKQALNLLNKGRADIYPVTVNHYISSVDDTSYKLSQFKYVYDFQELDVALYLATSNKTDPSLVKTLNKLFKCQEK